MVAPLIRHRSGTGGAKGPPPERRAPSDLHMCHVDDVVSLHPLTR